MIVGTVNSVVMLMTYEVLLAEGKSAWKIITIMIIMIITIMIIEVRHAIAGATKTHCVDIGLSRGAPISTIYRQIMTT